MPRLPTSRPARQSVQVEADIAAAYKKVADDSGLSVSEVIRRIGKWIAAQPDYIQGEVLGTTPPSLRRDVAQLILERRAQGQDKFLSLNEPAPPPYGRKKP